MLPQVKHPPFLYSENDYWKWNLKKLREHKFEDDGFTNETGFYFVKELNRQIKEFNDIISGLSLLVRCIEVIEEEKSDLFTKDELNDLRYLKHMLYKFMSSASGNKWVVHGLKTVIKVNKVPLEWKHYISKLIEKNQARINNFNNLYIPENIKVTRLYPYLAYLNKRNLSLYEDGMNFYEFNYDDFSNLSSDEIREKIKETGYVDYILSFVFNLVEDEEVKKEMAEAYEQYLKRREQLAILKAKEAIEKEEKNEEAAREEVLFLSGRASDVVYRSRKKITRVRCSSDICYVVAVSRISGKTYHGKNYISGYFGFKTSSNRSLTKVPKYIRIFTSMDEAKEAVQKYKDAYADDKVFYQIAEVINNNAFFA